MNKKFKVKPSQSREAGVWGRQPPAKNWDSHVHSAGFMNRKRSPGTPRCLRKISPIHPLRKCTGKMKGNVNVIGIKAGVWGRQPPEKIWGLSCLQRGIDKWENVAQRASHVSQKAPHPTSPIPAELGGPPGGAPPASRRGGPPED